MTDQISTANVDLSGEKMSDLISKGSSGFMGRMRNRMAELHATDRADAGYSAVEWVIIIGIIIVIAVIASVAISNAVTTKSSTVGNCITGASSTQAGGCK